MMSLMGRVPRLRGFAPDSVLPRSRGPARVWLLLAIATVSSPLPGFADYEEYLVNDDAFGQENRFGPAAIELDDGSTLALWSDNGRGHTDILARKISSTLTPAGDAFRVNSDEGLFQHDHLFASAKGGGVAFVVWEGELPRYRGVFGRAFRTADGAAIGPDFQINAELGFGDALAPRVATNSQGESMVVWISTLGPRSRVIAQFIDDQGIRMGKNFDPVPDETERSHATPAVGTLPDGRWILAWAETGTNNDWNIAYRFLNADGEPDGGIRRANTDLFGLAPQIEPAVLVRTNDIVLAWSDARTGDLDIWGRFLDHDGEPIAEDRLFRASESAGDGAPRLTLGNDGGFALTWFGAVQERQRWMVRLFDAAGEGIDAGRPFDDPESGVLMRGGCIARHADGWRLIWADNQSYYYDLWARTMNTQGNIGVAKPIYEVPQSSSQVFADVALFPDGRAIVVWSELQFGAQAIFGRFLDASGKPAGESFQVSAIPANANFNTIDGLSQLIEFSPSVAASADGFVVTWAINQEGGRLNLFGQYYEADGTRIGTNFQIAPDQMLTPQFGARPAMMPGGGFAIAARINVSDNGGDVFLQLYGANGLPNGSRIQCADAPSAAQIRPAVAISDDGTIAVVWMDQRFGGWDVFLQRFTRNGTRIRENEIQHSEDESFSDQTTPDVDIQSDRVIAIWETRPQLEGLIEGRLEIFPSAAREGDENVKSLVINRDRVLKGPKSPKVAMNPDGRFVVCWWENVDGQTQTWAQRFEPGGAPIDEPYPIHGTGIEGSRLDPRVDVLGETIQFVWSDSRRGKGWDIRARRVDWDFAGAPSPVRLERFDANATPRGVEVSWRTASEIDFSEFRVWRDEAESLDGGSNEPGAEATLVSADIRPAETGEYEIVDAGAPNGFVAYYLEAIDRDGSAEFFGPASVRVAPDGIALPAWPNPSSDQVHFRLAHGVRRVHIIDAAGRRLRSLDMQRATQAWMWDGLDATGQETPAGLYFAHAAGTNETVRILRVR